MSWARFGWDESEVYIYRDVHGGYVCQGCLLLPHVKTKYGTSRKTFRCDTSDEMYKHIVAHSDAGHGIPPKLIKEAIEATREMPL